MDDVKSLPMAEEAEAGVVGSLLLDAYSTVDLAVNKYRLRPEAFWNKKWRRLYEVMTTMVEHGHDVGLCSLMAELERTEALDEVGGYAAVEGLIDRVPTSAHAEYFCDLVRQKWIMRECIYRARELINDCHVADRGDTLLAGVAERFLEIADQVVRTRSRREVLNEIVNQVELVGKPGYVFPGVSTPWPELNEKLNGGFQNGRLHILAGEQSAGKTTFEGVLCEHAARTGYPVGRATLDADEVELLQRDLSRNAGVSLPKMLGGYVFDNGVKKLRGAVDRIADYPMYFYEECFTVGHFATWARMMKARKGIKLLTLDYIQLMITGDAQVDRDDIRRVGYVALTLKRLAKELNLPVLILSQFNRQGKSADRYPLLNDLKNSSVLEEAVFTAILLYKDRKCRETHFRRPVWVDLAKNKNGQRGALEFWMRPNYFNFEYAGEDAFESEDAAERLDARAGDGPLGALGAGREGDTGVACTGKDEGYEPEMF